MGVPAPSGTSISHYFGLAVTDGYPCHGSLYLLFDLWHIKSDCDPAYLLDTMALVLCFRLLILFSLFSVSAFLSG